MDGPPPMAGKGKERHLERSLRTQQIAVAPLHERPRVFTGIITGKYFSLVGIAAVFLFPPPNRSIWQPTKQCKRPMQVRKAASPPTRMVALSLRRLPGSVCYDCSRWWGHFTFSFQGTFQYIHQTCAKCRCWPKAAESGGSEFVSSHIVPALSCSLSAVLAATCTCRMPSGSSLSLCSADCSGRAGQPAVISQGNWLPSYW